MQADSSRYWLIRALIVMGIVVVVMVITAFVATGVREDVVTLGQTALHATYVNPTMKHFLDQTATQAAHHEQTATALAQTPTATPLHTTSNANDD